MALIKGYNLEGDQRDWIDEKIGRIIPEDVWKLTMTGELLLVAQDLAEAMVKGVLHKPQSAREREQTEMGSGWIIAVGPNAGSGNHGLYPLGAVCQHPKDLLGRHIIYQMWAGKTLRTDTSRDDEFTTKDSHLIVLTDRDVQALVLLDEDINEAKK